MKDLSYREEKDYLPSIHESMALNVAAYAAISGKRIFLRLNKFNVQDYYPPEDDHRKNPIVINQSYQDIDSILFTFPEGFRIEAQPDNINIENEFGSFETILIISGRTITYLRKLTIKAGVHPTESYPDLRLFFESISKIDHGQVVLVKESKGP